MSTGARELRPMFSFNPSEPAILHERITDNIETWTGEEEADYREIPSRYLMGQWRGGSSSSTDGATCWAANETRHRAFCSLGTLYLRDG